MNEPGHCLVPSEELKGEALAWAVAAVYQVPAAILEGCVHVEAEPGKWLQFDPWDMLRSLVIGHVPAVHVPDEIASSLGQVLALDAAAVSTVCCVRDEGARQRCKPVEPSPAPSTAAGRILVDADN